MEVRKSGGIVKWLFQKAEWDEFQRLSEESMNRIEMLGDIDEINKQVTSAIIRAADGAIPKSKGKKIRKMVPWWTEECQQAVRNRNRWYHGGQKNVIRL